MLDPKACAELNATACPIFLKAGGECGNLIAARNWLETSLGPIHEWPCHLTSAVSMLLRSRLPIVLLWGSEGVMLYNDAYSGFAGARHPESLGAHVLCEWPEIAEFNESVMRIVLGGKTLNYRDQQLTLHRNGLPERVWMDLDYSPILDDAGEPAGVICFLSETTERVLAENRAKFLLALSDDLRSLGTPADIMNLTARRLGDTLAASRVFYAEIADGLMTVERDYAFGVPTIVGEHSLEAFGPDLLAAYRFGIPVVVQNVGLDGRLSRSYSSGGMWGLAGVA